MFRAIRLLSLAAAVLSAAAVPALSQALGDLAVTPTRVVFEGRTRTAQVSLVNRGAATATYRIRFIHYRMTEEGRFIRIKGEEAEKISAARFMRYSPRRVVLPPGGSQTVRLLLRKPRNLPTGEYRSHLYFSAIPKPNSGRNVEARGPVDGIRVRVTVIPGLSIPVIVRQGKLTAQGALSDVAIKKAKVTGNHKKPRQIAMKIKRVGNRSLYGDVTVTYRPENTGREYVLARVTRMAVYTPVSFRQVVLPLQIPQGLRLGRGRLHVAYRRPAREGGELIAERRISLP